MGHVRAADEARETELMRMMETHGGMLAGLCTALLGDAHLAQDIVQETFLRAWRRMDSLRGGRASEKAWLCRIAVNLCRDHQRTRWFRLERPSDDSLWEGIAAPEEEDRGILEAVLSLPGRMREVILLHYWQDMDACEMADALGLTVSAVYRRLRQARKQLKQRLEGWEHDE